MISLRHAGDDEMVRGWTAWVLGKPAGRWLFLAQARRHGRRDRHRNPGLRAVTRTSTGHAGSRTLPRHRRLPRSRTDLTIVGVFLVFATIDSNFNE